MRTANAAKALILIAGCLAGHGAPAADPAAGLESAAAARPEAAVALPAPDGAQVFATHCAMCHKPAALARRLQDAADPEAATADLAIFLTRHGRSDAAADQAIIDYLAGMR